ncbi:MAG: hypothetical protein U5S82_19945 [Gammaproteobacteria bacterium]|nr:hypothetical protein [Gammaproteobacteria bacterium]
MSKSLKPRSVFAESEDGRGMLNGSLPEVVVTSMYEYEDILENFALNPKKGLEYQRLAEAGDPKGQFAFAMYALHGYPPTCFTDGMAWMRASAQGGFRAAQYFLGRFYSAPVREEAEVQAAWAAKILAEIFDQGAGVPRNAGVASRWWEMSAHWNEFIPDSVVTGQQLAERVAGEP